ncbi:23S rRNA (guanosine(2251)-2'-O)-methyltransferase RlmB [Phenylobacterium montanum]|uniref:23S rRNA (guanosine(2251)-2'-O)-methyltransferase RlmB n=1 Tax=Phenylobacterium montanum TaxID=2823693 RepID=UPI00201338D9|nr:23S rRNA (guanosine(2251)-2'-O)-methyltransferase RlmB [Caulobacter sp. S6]
MASFRERNDRKFRPKTGAERPSQGRPGPHKAPHKSAHDKASSDWLWGWHAVEAALANPRREKPRRLLASEDRARQLTERFGQPPALEIADAAQIARALPAGAVHQGVALKIDPLEPLPLDELAEDRSGPLVMLDQLTDPQNVGAIFRSAAAFGARGIILQDRNAPALAGALAKAAVGAVDILPHARVTNLSRALERLADLGWRAVGLDGAAQETLEAVLDERPTVLVLGSEGEGIRRLVSEHCDALARIPMPGGFESLNVSAAAAVALYELSRPRGTGAKG